LNSALEAMNRELRLAGHGAAVVQASALFRPVFLSFFSLLPPDQFSAVDF
jgi:hypothetical protein